MTPHREPQNHIELLVELLAIDNKHRVTDPDTGITLMLALIDAYVARKMDEALHEAAERADKWYTIPDYTSGTRRNLRTAVLGKAREEKRDE